MKETGSMGVPSYVFISFISSPCFKFSGDGNLWGS